jgi:hypothetical protein
MSCSRDTVTADWGGPMMQFGQIRARNAPLVPVPHRHEGAQAPYGAENLYTPWIAISDRLLAKLLAGLSPFRKVPESCALS